MISGGQNNKRSPMTLNVSGLWDVVPRLDHYRYVYVRVCGGGVRNYIVKLTPVCVYTKKQRKRIITSNIKINPQEF